VIGTALAEIPGEVALIGSLDSIDTKQFQENYVNSR
jgi:hypothetical protein